MKNLMLATSIIALAAAHGTPASAQESGAGQTSTVTKVPQDQLQDIVVTAQRRAENVQHAALDITAVTGEQLRDRGITSTEQLSRLTAGLQVQPSGGPYTTFTVRSVSNLGGNAFADPAVAVNINGVYLATPTTIRGFYYDIERLEILKGPQGTLYGRNATAGAINILPNRPEFDFGGSLSADVGNFGKFDVNGALNVPISDTIAVRFAGQHARHLGYFSDGTNDEDVNAARASILFKPSSNFSLLLTGDWAHQGGKGPGATLRKSCASLGRPGESCFVADPYTDVGDLPQFFTAAGLAPQTRDPYLDGNYYGVGLNADLTTGIGTVTLVGGYRKSDVNYVTTATGWQIREDQHPTQKSLELRLASSAGKPLQYVFGAYYLDTSIHAIANGESASRKNFSDQHTNLSGWTGALFSQLTYGLSSTFRLVGGVRYTYEKKSSDSSRYTVNTLGPNPVIPQPPVTAPVYLIVGSQAWNRVNWKAGVEFDASPRNLLYANVSTGFKAGGFFSGPAGNNTFQPESVTSFALGSKNRFLNNKLQANIEAFYLDYKDQQISFVKVIGALAPLVTENAGKSRSFGFELETDYLLTPTTRLGAQVQYLNSKYQSFSYQTIAPPPSTSACRITAAGGGQSNVDCAGQTPLRSPRWTLVGSAQQTIPLNNGGKVVAEVAARYETQFQTDVSYLPVGLTLPKARTDLNLGYVAPHNRFTIKAYVDNVFDVVSITDATMSNSYAAINAFAVRLLAPRTFGVRGSVNY